MTRAEVISWYHSLTNDEKNQFRIACLEIFQLECLQHDKEEIKRYITVHGFDGLAISRLATLANTIIFESNG